MRATRPPGSSIPDNAEACERECGIVCSRGAWRRMPCVESKGRKAIESETGHVRVFGGVGGFFVVGVVVVAGGIVLAVVLSKRGKKGRSRHGDHASDRGPLPPVNPYPPQVSGANNGMVPPPAAGQYAPQQQAPYQAAFPQQAPHPAAPYPVPPQQAAQPPVMPGNTQNPYGRQQPVKKGSVRVVRTENRKRAPSPFRTSIGVP